MGAEYGKTLLSKLLNMSVWTGFFTSLYFAGINFIGRANEKIEDKFSKRPTIKEVSGYKHSLVSYDKLGAQGRRFVSQVLKPADINRVRQTKTAKQPIRTFVGYNSISLFPSARAERALQELDRTGAFERKYLLLVSPTGTGWVDQTMIESLELLSNGDVASCAIQYARFPSFLSLQKVELGKRQFQLLLWGIKLRLEQIPEKKRPKLLVFGESLGAWTSSDTIMKIGTKGLDHYGVDKVLWVGLPKLAKWAKVQKELSSRNELNRVTGVFDNIEQFNKLSDTRKNNLKVVILNHDNDPIAKLHPSILYREPGWLKNEKRGRGVSEKIRWTPIITFLQTAIDAGNAMNIIPGHFRSHGHDYRADMVDFVAAAYYIKTTDTRMKRIEKELIRLELARESR